MPEMLSPEERAKEELRKIMNDATGLGQAHNMAVERGIQTFYNMMVSTMFLSWIQTQPEPLKLIDDMLKQWKHHVYSANQGIIQQRIDLMSSEAGEYLKGKLDDGEAMRVALSKIVKDSEAKLQPFLDVVRKEINNGFEPFREG